MNKTLRISFSLRNTYRVNTILYSLKQIPLIKKLLPSSLYQVQGLKVFANILSAMLEFVSTFLGKMIYIVLMVVLPAKLYTSQDTVQLYMHILLFLSINGSFLNTYMFDPSKDKYYAIILMRMNAKDYTIINYLYSILKIVIGFFPITLMFSIAGGVPWWISLLIPFFIAGIKLFVAACHLIVYEKTGKVKSENSFTKYNWILVLTILACAYGLPFLNNTVHLYFTVAVMLLSIVCGAFSLHKILTFNSYREMYQPLLSGAVYQMNSVQDISLQISHNYISTDTLITSDKKGFAYLNELFIKRHQKILWKASIKTTYIALVAILGAFITIGLMPEFKAATNSLLLTFLPYFVFIMYMINRGTGFTSALFINCDHSLLTYSFYKQPAFVLKLFQIRLLEIIKINLLPAGVIGTGLALMLYISGGTDNILNYLVLLVSILSMSIFFSVHYLTVYYLLQPYNAATEIKSGTYQIVISATYFLCYMMMQVKMSTLLFGIACITFCILYCIIASILIYKFAPKTFKIRT